MLEQFKVALAEGPEVPAAMLGLRLVLALIAGAAVAWLYQRTRNGAGAPSLPATLVLLAVLIAAVTQVIGDNIARAFSLVGALSIVRFRTVVRDTRDTAFVIFAVVVGMGIGAGHATVAAATLVVSGMAAWLMRSGRVLPPVPTDYDLTVRVGLGDDTQALAREMFPPFFESYVAGAASTARQGSALEVTWHTALRPGIDSADVVRALSRREGVQSVEMRPREEGS
jgi:hypothetical protein